MIVVISLIMILSFLLSAVVIMCLCKESINWRNEQCGYDLEESIELSKKAKLVRKEITNQRNPGVKFWVSDSYFIKNVFLY